MTDPSPARVAAERGRSERRNADETARRRAQERAVTAEPASPVPAPTPDGQGDAESRAWDEASPPTQGATKMKVQPRDRRTGAHLIVIERQRQIEVEGYSHAHDRDHADESLALAACSYAVPWSWRRYKQVGLVSVPTTWPWDGEHFKPARDLGSTERIRELVKAGALIAAEIDRLQAVSA